MIGTRSASHSRLAASRSISAPPLCIGKLYSVLLFGEVEMCSGQPSNSDTIVRSSMARSTMFCAPGPDMSDSAADAG